MARGAAFSGVTPEDARLDGLTQIVRSFIGGGLATPGSFVLNVIARVTVLSAVELNRAIVFGSVAIAPGRAVRWFSENPPKPKLSYGPFPKPARVRCPIANKIRT